MEPKVLKKFIPASDYESVIPIARKLLGQGFVPIINILGEHCVDRDEIEHAVREYLYLIDRLGDGGIKGKISVKPTQIGLEISKELYFYNILRIVRRAHLQKIPLEIDMESLKYCQDILDVFCQISGGCDVRQAVQAYLQRGLADVVVLITKFNKKIRLVKGAYGESDLSSSAAKKQLVLLTEMLLLKANDQAIATIRDESFIDAVRTICASRDIVKNSFIIQTLYGIRDDLKHRLQNEGFKVEIYVPIGPWRKAIPFIFRRLKEITF